MRIVFFSGKQNQKLGFKLRAEIYKRGLKGNSFAHRMVLTYMELLDKVDEAGTVTAF